MTIDRKVGRARQRAWWRWTAAAAVLGLGAAVSAPLDAAEPTVIRLQGSTTFNTRLIEPHRDEIEGRAGVRLSVIPSKSIWGLIALVEKRTDLAMISASLESEFDALQKTAGADAARDLKSVEVARSRVAFAVHPSNPVRRLSSEQVRSILLGENRNWKEVGGADLPIRVVATQDGGGTVAAVRAQLLGGQGITAPEAIRLESAKHVVKVVTQEPGAIAIAQLSLANAAGLAEVETPQPVEQLLCLVMKGEPSAAMVALIDAARSVAREKGL
jgi:phosphate transport system substrate-binding protein